jgi:hypothetical protein
VEGFAGHAVDRDCGIAELVCGSSHLFSFPLMPTKRRQSRVPE